MKKWISILLMAVALLALCCAGAHAESGSIRHLVTGDISEFEVRDELDRVRLNPPQTQGELGTDVYLFVDPDTASYVTIYVTDEQGNPIRGAQVYISYDGVEEFFGVTDENGILRTYLFRDVEYGYRVVKNGYETATGTFIATESTKRVHVVLRRLYDLTIYVVDNGTPLPGITVIIDGKTYITDAAGKVTVRKPNGEYNVIVIAPDGRRIPVQAVVRGNTTIVVDIGKDNALVEGGRYNDRFLVYNKLYNPEDYELTYYGFKPEDLTKYEDESDEAFAARVSRYLAGRTDTILIEAQPERRQNRDGTDTDIYDGNGEPVYAQRSLMPTGYLLKIWEEMGYTDLVFTNEDFGVRLDMNALHTGDMAKFYALLAAKENGRHARTVAKPESKYTAAVDAMHRMSEENLDVSKIDFSVIDDFEFAFDHAHACGEDETAAEHRLVDDGLYTNTLFEFRITPILPTALQDMIRDGLRGEEAFERDTIMLASRGYYAEELRRWRADGKLTETECAELFHYIADGMLTAQEMKELRAKAKAYMLPFDAISSLLGSSLDEKVYRLSCWVIYGNAKINVTELMDGMISMWKVDEQFDREFAALTESMKTDGLTVRRAASAALEARYELMTVDNLGKSDYEKGYTPGVNTALHDVKMICSLPDEDDEFHLLLSGRWFDSITVDVRREDTTIGNNWESWYRAYLTYDMTQLLDRRALTAPNEISGLAALVFAR